MRTVTGVSLLLGAVAAVGCGGREAGPANAWRDFQAALQAKDGAKAWDLLSKDTKAYFDLAGERARQSAGTENGATAWSEFLECSPKEVASLTGKKIFIAHVEKMDRLTSKSDEPTRPMNHIRELRDATKIYDIDVQLNIAKAKVTIAEGQFVAIEFTAEGTDWKIKPQDRRIIWPRDT